MATTVMVAQLVAAVFFGYLWATRKDLVQTVGNQVPAANNSYTKDDITAYAAMAISCVVLVVIQYFIRKSPRLMRLFIK